MRHIWFLCIAFSLVALSACSSEETPVTGAGDSTIANSNAAADPLTGTWTGNWGPTQDQRNPVTVALKWDGTNLSGTVNPGPEAVAITKGSFAPDTGMVMLEAFGNSTGNGKMIHYTVEGKLVEGTITGTWIDDDKKGDFKITKG